MRRCSTAFAVALALALAASAGAIARSARAQDADAGAVETLDGGPPALEVTITAEPEAPPPTEPVATEPSSAASPRAAARATARVVPNYDGRVDEPTTVGDVLIWIPRVIFAPLYFVTEFVLRRPLGWIVSTAERANLPGLLLDFFTFNDKRSAGFAPTALIDFGLKPSVGLYVFWDDVGFVGHDLRLRAATWGIDWITVSTAERYRFSDRARTALKFAFSRRPDWRFFGLGPEVARDDFSRYSSTSFDLGLSFEAEPWRASSIRWYTGWRNATFEDQTCCSDPSIGERVAQGRFALPPGFADGYAVWLQRMSLAFDTRESAGGSGFRVELRGEQAFDVVDPARRSWIKYGGVIGGFLDLTGTRRVVGVSLSAFFADALFADGRPSSAIIPFTEQIALGGDELMRGFLAGELIDTSAVVATVEYRWPVWIWLDGSVQAAVGNVLPGHLDHFSLDLMRLSTTVGFRTSSRADHSFDLLFGFGTEPFGDGFQISSFRFVIGTKEGF